MIAFVVLGSFLGLLRVRDVQKGRQRAYVKSLQDFAPIWSVSATNSIDYVLGSQPISSFAVGIQHAPEFTDAQLEGINALSNLRYLNLSNTSITDEGVKKLRKLTTLQLLKLNNTSISDGSVESLLCLQKLEILEVYETNITRDGSKKLRDGLPGASVGWFPIEKEKRER